MSNDVVLSAALRNNLLSLQQTQSEVDLHQNRLATGKKVNSALDNPQAYFAAASLNSRASALSNLLDSIGQSIQVINAANNGVTALTQLVNSAQGIANAAQSALAGATTQASQTGNVALTADTKWSSIAGLAASNTIVIDVRDPTGGTNSLNNASYVVQAGDTVGDVISHINDLNTASNVTALSVSLNSAGQLNFTAINGGTMDVSFMNTSNASFNDATSLAMAASLGFGSLAKINIIQGGGGTTGDQVGFTALATSTLNSGALYATTNGVTAIANGSATLTGLKTDATGATTATTIAAAATLNLVVGGKSSADLLHITSGGFSGAGNTTTINTLVDAINHDSTIGSLVSASYNTTTGQIVLTSLGSSATDVQFQFGSNAANTLGVNVGTGLNFGTQVLTTGAAANSSRAQEDVYFGAAASSLANLQTEYNSTLTQINNLVKDTGYGGTNLLASQNLTTYFDENRTTSLTTNGVNFNASGLGLTTGNFQNTAAINNSIQQTITALTTIQNFGSTIANDLATIQSRQTFTTSLVNTLQTGADALTNADQNTEGATLLALQTRLSLGVTSLSLASQAQQAILKLF
jgi:flagellin